MVNDFGASGDELQEIVNVKSVAAGGLFKWVTNTLNCYDIKFKWIKSSRPQL